MVKSGTFWFISPLGPDVADRIRWYVEEFPRYPFLEKILNRAEEIAAQFPGWGKALLKPVKMLLDPTFLTAKTVVKVKVAGNN